MMTTKPNPTITIGDSREMRELKDESVHLVITSPPYCLKPSPFSAFDDR